MGTSLTVAYEHVHITPSGELVRELLETLLENEVLNLDNLKNFGTMSSYLILRDTSSDVRRLIVDDGDVKVEELLSISVINTAFLSSDCVSCLVKDIGLGIGNLNVPSTGVVVFDAQKVMNEMYEVSDGNQVTRNKLDSAPPWVLAKVAESAVKSN